MLGHIELSHAPAADASHSAQPTLNFSPTDSLHSDTQLLLHAQLQLIDPAYKTPNGLFLRPNEPHHTYVHLRLISTNNAHPVSAGRNHTFDAPTLCLHFNSENGHYVCSPFDVVTPCAAAL